MAILDAARTNGLREIVTDLEEEAERLYAEGLELHRRSRASKEAAELLRQKYPNAFNGITSVQTKEACDVPAASTVPQRSTQTEKTCVDMILDILGKSDRPLSPKDLNVEMIEAGNAFTVGTIAAALSRMVNKDGTVERVGVGFYKLRLLPKPLPIEPGSDVCHSGVSEFLEEHSPNL